MNHDYSSSPPPSPIIHASTSAPSVSGAPERRLPQEQIARFHRFQTNSRQHVSRSAVINLIMNFETYTAQLRTDLDAVLNTLRQQEGNSTDGACERITDRLEWLRQSAPLQALETLPTDKPVGNYIVRLAEHYPEAPNPNQASPRDRLRMLLTAVLNDMLEVYEEDLKRNRQCVAEIVGAQAGIAGMIQELKNHLKAHAAAPDSPSSPALHATLNDALEKLSAPIGEFSQILEQHLDRIEQPATARTSAR